MNQGTALARLIENTDDFIAPEKRVEYELKIKPILSGAAYLTDSLNTIIDSQKVVYDKILEFIPFERQEEYHRSYQLILADYKRELIDRLSLSPILGSTERGRDLEQTLLELRATATRTIRHLHLLNPIDQSDFEATLGWMIEQGGEKELTLIHEVKRKLPFDSEQIHDWIDEAALRITERKIIEKLKSRKVRLGIQGGENISLNFYRVYGLSATFDGCPPEAVIIESYPAFSIISAPENTISTLRQKYAVEMLQPAIPSIFFSPMPILERMQMPMRDYIVRFLPSKRSLVKKQLEEAGAKILQPLGGTDYPDYIVEIPNKNVMESVEDLPVLWVKPFQPSIRVNLNRYPSLSNQLDQEAVSTSSEQDEPAVIPNTFYASFFTTQDRDLADAVWRSQGIDIVEKVGNRDLIVNISEVVNSEYALDVLVRQVGLRYLEEELKVSLLSSAACEVIGIQASGVNEPILNLTGKGEILAIADTGLDNGHPDFQGRVKAIQPHRSGLPVVDEDGHGTHVAGIALGDGSHASLMNLSVKGAAPEAELFFQSGVRNDAPVPDITTLFETAYEQGARVHSNSWKVTGSVFFASRAEQVDEFIWNHKDFLVVFAAGNDARQQYHGGEISQRNVSIPGVAKNCLTVGACENDRPNIRVNYGTWKPSIFCHSPINSDGMTDSVDHIAPFSSRGPTWATHSLLDMSGRRKPDVVAPGTFILSARSSQAVNPPEPFDVYHEAPNHYVYMTGTSMATPLVAGAALLVRQYLREQRRISNPSAALLKAALIHCAKHFPYYYPHPESTPYADNEQGWGRIYLPNILSPIAPTQVFFIDEEKPLDQGDSMEYSVEVEEEKSEFRATLVYTDLPDSGGVLMNNLNLEVTDPNGKVYYGNDFGDTGKSDDVNNVEGVVVETVHGQWKVKVIAKRIIEAQDFALVLSASGLKIAV